MRHTLHSISLHWRRWQQQQVELESSVGELKSVYLMREWFISAIFSFLCALQLLISTQTFTTGNTFISGYAFTIYKKKFWIAQKLILFSLRPFYVNKNQVPVSLITLNIYHKIWRIWKVQLLFKTLMVFRLMHIDSFVSCIRHIEFDIYNIYNISDFFFTVQSIVRWENLETELLWKSRTQPKTLQFRKIREKNPFYFHREISAFWAQENFNLIANKIVWH